MNSTWNLADLIAIARTSPECAQMPLPALLRGAQHYAARDATPAQLFSAADVARDPAVAARLRQWAQVAA